VFLDEALVGWGDQTSKAAWKSVHSNDCMVIVIQKSDAYHLVTVRKTVIDNRHAKATDDIRRSPLS
jgi:hypothetical protein